MSGPGVPIRPCGGCGFTWFQLKDDELPDNLGVLCVNTDGQIAGRCGTLVCARCGDVLDIHDDVVGVAGATDRPRLRAVQ